MLRAETFEISVSSSLKAMSTSLEKGKDGSPDSFVAKEDDVEDMHDDMEGDNFFIDCDF